MYKLFDDNYNKLKNDISKKLDVGKNYNYEFNENIVEIYLGNKLKLKAEYELIGLYNIPMSTWYWAWNIAFLNKDLYKTTLKIKDYDDILKKEYKKFDKVEAEELHYLVGNDTFYISSKNIDKILKMALYLTNAIWYFPVKYADNNSKTDMEELDKVEYIIIKKVLQYS